MEHKIAADRVNIIVIDDDQISVKITSLLIKRELPECNIIVFYEPRQGLSFFADKVAGQIFVAPVILLLDIHMSTMDAWDFIGNATTINPRMFNNVTVYILSASIHPLDLERAYTHPVVKNYLTKPLREEVILSF